MGLFVNVKLVGLVQHVQKILMSAQIHLYLALFAKTVVNVRIDHRRHDFLATVHQNIMATHVRKSIMTAHKVNVAEKGHAWIKTELSMALKLMNVFVSPDLNYRQMERLVLILMNVSQVRVIQAFNVKILMVHINVKAVQPE